MVELLKKDFTSVSKGKEVWINLHKDAKVIYWRTSYRILHKPRGQSIQIFYVLPDGD